MARDNDQSEVARLWQAVLAGDTKVASALIRKCGDLNTVYKSGMTPLEFAISTGRHDIAEALRGAGARTCSEVTLGIGMKMILDQTYDGLVSSGNRREAEICRVAGAKQNIPIDIEQTANVLNQVGMKFPFHLPSVDELFERYRKERVTGVAKRFLLVLLPTIIILPLPIMLHHLLPDAVVWNWLHPVVCSLFLLACAGLLLVPSIREVIRLGRAMARWDEPRKAYEKAYLEQRRAQDKEIDDKREEQKRKEDALRPLGYAEHLDEHHERVHCPDCGTYVVKDMKKKDGISNERLVHTWGVYYCGFCKREFDWTITIYQRDDA